MPHNRDICRSGKVRFLTEAKAFLVGMREEAKHGKPQYVYDCPICKGFHLTTKTYGEEVRSDEIPVSDMRRRAQPEDEL